MSGAIASPLSPVFIQTQSFALASSQSWLPLLRPSILLAAASDCVWMETGLYDDGDCVLRCTVPEQWSCCVKDSLHSSRAERDNTRHMCAKIKQLLRKSSNEIWQHANIATNAISANVNKIQRAKQISVDQLALVSMRRSSYDAFTLHTCSPDTSCSSPIHVSGVNAALFIAVYILHGSYSRHTVLHFEPISDGAHVRRQRGFQGTTTSL